MHAPSPFGPRSFITPNEAGATVSATGWRLARRRRITAHAGYRLYPVRVYRPTGVFARFAGGQLCCLPRGWEMIKAAHLLAAASPLGGGSRGDGWTGAAIAAAFAHAVESGRLDLPLPGGGRTRERWAVLAELAGEALCLARVAQGAAHELGV